MTLDERMREKVMRIIIICICCMFLSGCGLMWVATGDSGVQDWGGKTFATEEELNEYLERIEKIKERNSRDAR